MPELLKVVTEEDELRDHFEILADEPKTRGKQENLFHSDELLLPEAINLYRKPVAAIHSIPERRDVSLKLSARKLLEALPLAVQLDLRSRRKEQAQALVRKVREDRATPLFEIRTKELARLAGLSASNMERIHETLAELVGFRFAWNVLGEDGTVQYESVAPFLIRRDKGVGEKLGYTRFAFEPEILLWFLEPNMWANLSWTVLSGIGRDSGPGQEAAFGLYQNIWRYIGTSAKVTPALDLATWIDLIIGPSRFVQVDQKGAKKVSDYKDFKRRYLVPGLEILNAHPALNHTVEFKEEKSGRRVVRLRFKFVPKLQKGFDFPLGWPPESLKLLEDIGFPEQEISNLSQLYPYDQVAEALKRLPIAESRLRNKGSRVYSRVAFFRGILANIAKGEEQSEAEDARLLEEAAKKKQQEIEEQRMRTLQERFAAHQRGILTPAIQAMPPEERDKLMEDHLAARPQDRIMFKPGKLDGMYFILFCQWLAEARPELHASFLPEAKDRDFQSWMAWQLHQVT
ncbi:replication initiation protein [Thiobacillus denitrificans]|uniref:replication initiation protein n=1 Tax=Thiobacillus denitrificans TaxID=36861 RepID=UPI0003795C82|nr:replication initiation protein [Thiobacillus denitrificans]